MYSRMQNIFGICVPPFGLMPKKKPKPLANAAAEVYNICIITLL